LLRKLAGILQPRRRLERERQRIGDNTKASDPGPIRLPQSLARKRNSPPLGFQAETFTHIPHAFLPRIPPSGVFEERQITQDSARSQMLKCVTRRSKGDKCTYTQLGLLRSMPISTSPAVRGYLAPFGCCLKTFSSRLEAKVLAASQVIKNPPRMFCT
jgi:hypothetical protein